MWQSPSLSQWRKLLGYGKKKQPVQKKARLSVETLENRLVPTGGPTHLSTGVTIIVDPGKTCDVDPADVSPVFYSSSDGFYHACNLRSAIAAANGQDPSAVKNGCYFYLNGDDTIKLQTDIYHVCYGEFDILETAGTYGSGSLTIQNKDGKGISVIEVDSADAKPVFVGPSPNTPSADSSDRIFKIEKSCNGKQTTLKWLYLTDGHDDVKGGAILNCGKLNIIQSVLAHNTVGADCSPCDAKGGAIFNASGACLTITSCSFECNEADGSNWYSTNGLGGAIYAESCSTTSITGTTFLSNIARGGDFCALSINPFAVSPNQAEIGSGKAGDGMGGAIYGECDASITVTNSTFSKNKAIGGSVNGVQNTAATPSLTTIGNGAYGGGNALGGAMYLKWHKGSKAVVKIINCTVAENKVIAGTGSSFCFNGSAYGGGIATCADPCGINIQNTIVALNKVCSAGAEQSAVRPSDFISSGWGSCSSPDVYGNFNSLGHNLIGILDCGASGFSTAKKDILGTCASPQDPGLYTLAYDGGPKISGPSGYNLIIQVYALRNSSICVDHADDSVTSFLSTDERAAPFKRKFGTHVDIGAYELQGLLGQGRTIPLT